ncbi:hypothetical protein LCGC14_1109450, partial [marine sediment metagenome]
MTICTGDGWEVRGGKWQESPPEMVDHVISDPPYTDYVSARAKQRTLLSSRQGHTIAEGEGSLSFDGVDERELGPLLVVHVKRWIILFCAIEQIGGYADACSDHWIRGGWWEKSVPTPQFTGDRPGVPGEAIAIMHPPGKKRWNGGGCAARWVGPNTNSSRSEHDERVHETQKPLWLMAALIEAFTDPGDLVWAPYMGSATTGVACLLAGRRFLGHELQEQY